MRTHKHKGKFCWGGLRRPLFDIIYLYQRPPTRLF
ncbi:hypothetical protein PP242_gp23 [Streptococcus phage P7602]|uniref:Uncharacterized protein n=1 Tax=Streptococcus phage P7602 TaxID=1971432 RepID=A0A286QRD9_9CAUD|nr:hypothetical protein PP242_gp23 [Streptococcus phage P7602]ARU14015.1 hypothetical protein P7602_23 [Streptococcus phage P7602]